MAAFGEREAALSSCVLPSTDPSSGVLFPSAQALLPWPWWPVHPPFLAGSPCFVHPRDSLVVFPGEVFVMGTEVQDFIVSECGQCLPMWASIGLLEYLWLQPSLCKFG